MIFRGLSAKSHDICQFSVRANVVSFSCSVSMMKRQHTMLSFLSSNGHGDKASLHREILLEMCFRQWFERSLENKISRQRKSSEFETIRTRIVIRFHNDAICS